MKKLLFCVQTLVCGGVEKELSTIISKLKENYEITVLLFYIQDEKMLETIPTDIRVVNLDIDRNYFCSSLPNLIWARLKRGEFSDAFSLFFKKVLNIGSTPANINMSAIDPLHAYYDVAVCYHLHSPLVLRYVADKVNANKKVAWIHNDFYTTGFKIAALDKSLSSYDEFVAVSGRLGKEFSSICPKYADKLRVAHNVVDGESIHTMADELADIDPLFATDHSFKIVTVGRFVEQKGFDIAIKVAKILNEKGLDFHWYAIGYGVCEDEMNKMVEKYNLGERFYILGRKSNPYPYIKMADLYVQPSRHEGYAITIEEAKVLGKYIICTDFAGADEQIIQGGNGEISKSFEPEAIAELIISFIHEPKSVGCSDEEIKWKVINSIFE